MSATTRCQRIARSATAPRNTTGPDRRAAMRRSGRLADDLRKGARDPLDLPVGHLREERQRQRAGGDVLAHRALALAVAERLAVVGHQVDRRQIRLARDAVLVAERAQDIVAILTVRDLHDVDEPAADVAARVRARQPEALDPGERLAVARGDPGAVGEHAVEALELGEDDRARYAGEAVVEAEAIVVEPPHVRRAALVALGGDARLQRRVADRDDAALAGRQLHLAVEAEDGRMAARAARHAVPLYGAERLAGVLDDRQAELLERGQVGGVAEDMDRQDGARTLRDRGRGRVRGEVQRDRVDV